MDITGNPWIILAADVAPGAPLLVSNGSGGFMLIVWKGAAHIFQVEMMEYTSDSDTCDINKLNQKDFWDGNGAQDLETVRSGNLGWTNDGITIPQGGIISGIVKIYHK